MLHIPDIDRWEEWKVDLDKVMEDIDYCLIDGTFYSEKELEKIGRSYKEIPHPLITASMETFKRYTDRTKIYFTHFNHSNPLIGSDEYFREHIKAKGFYVLEEEQEFSL